MKLYIDEVTLKDVLNVLKGLPGSLVDLVKEELFWWFKLYHFEISYPVDWEKLRAKELAKSRRRMRKNKSRGG